MLLFKNFMKIKGPEIKNQVPLFTFHFLYSFLVLLLYFLFGASFHIWKLDFCPALNQYTKNRACMELADRITFRAHNLHASIAGSFTGITRSLVDDWVHSWRFAVPAGISLKVANKLAVIEVSQALKGQGNILGPLHWDKSCWWVPTWGKLNPCVTPWIN